MITYFSVLVNVILRINAVILRNVEKGCCHYKAITAFSYSIPTAYIIQINTKYSALMLKIWVYGACEGLVPRFSVIIRFFVAKTVVCAICAQNGKISAQKRVALT